MTNARETSVMMPVEPSEVVIDEIICSLDGWYDFGNEEIAKDIYRDIIAAHMQEQDQ